MSIWRPDPSRLPRPAYLSLAEQYSRAILDGRLESGSQLPPHRKLADDLGLSVQTVSRAYEELIRRGLVAGEVGRGSFVSARRKEPDPPYLPERPGEVIDLSILKPVCDPLHVEAMKAAFGWLAKSIPSSAVLSFRPNMIFPRHRTAAVVWLKACGLDVAPENVHVTNGATAGMTAALMAVAPPGSTVVTEAIGHHTLTPLASYLGLTLEGAAIDEEGLIPEALDKACRSGTVRAAFVQPSVINPTATLMGERRRRDLAEVARKHDIAIVENDVLGPLVAPRPAPLLAFAPERTLYVTSFTKCVVPGLRIGYLVAPDRYAAAVANRHLVAHWMATPAMAEIATRWVQDGTAMELVQWQRTALKRRHDIAARALKGVVHRTHPQALHVWTPLSGAWTEARFVAQARLQGVAIAAGEAFRIAKTERSPAARIALGSSTEEELRVGLGAIAKLAIADPEHLLLAI